MLFSTDLEHVKVYSYLLEQVGISFESLSSVFEQSSCKSYK
jgi:hypothetical protein